MPTYNNGSNSNLDSDGKCAVVLMRVEAMEAQRALNRTPRAAHPAKTKFRKLPRGDIRRSYTESPAGFRVFQPDVPLLISPSAACGRNQA